MLNFTIDYGQIKLIENIPLEKDDLTYINEGCKAFKMSPLVPASGVMILMYLLLWLILDDQKKFTGSDYLFYAAIVFGISIFTYFVVRFTNRSHLKNFRKDSEFGKCQLTSFIIDNYEGESHEKLILAGPLAGDAIMLEVNRSDFRRYAIGTKVIVTYLKYSGEALLMKKYT